MLYRRFGQVAFDASVIGFGAASISGDGGGYSFGQITEDASVKLVHTSQDLGINVFDTAPIYGFGQSEQRLGAALREYATRLCAGCLWPRPTTRAEPCSSKVLS